MEWDSKAVEAFIQMPLSGLAKSMAKVFAEKKARKNKSSKVTMKEIEETKKVYYESVPEVVRRKEWEKRIKEGEADLMEKVEKESREILATNVDLFDVDLCHAQYFRCGSQIVEVRELKKEIEEKLRKLNVTEMVADMLHDNERILPHHRVTFSVSACSNGCTGPETKEFGIHGVAKPVVTDAECTECYACVLRCPDNAIIVMNGKPKIDYGKCKICEACVRACPQGVLKTDKKGYRIMVGGSFGRHHKVAHELFKIADKETLFKVIDAGIKVIREQAIGEESITSIVDRVGVAPIFEKMYK